MTTELDRGRFVAPTAGDHRIDPARSRIAVSTRHLFGLAAVHGTVDLEDGVIRVAEPLEDSRARASISARSIATGHPARDRHVRSSRLLDTAAYPRITFVADRLLLSAPCPVLVGSLVVRGRAGAVELLIEEVDQSGPELRVRAHTRIDRYAFGVTRYRGLAARHLDVRLDLVATRDRRTPLAPVEGVVAGTPAGRLRDVVPTPAGDPGSRRRAADGGAAHP